MSKPSPKPPIYQPPIYQRLVAEAAIRGLTLQAPPPGWRLVITPKGYMDEEFRARLAKYKDEIVWFLISRDFTPEPEVSGWLHDVAPDLLERIRKHRLAANKMANLGEHDELVKHATKYRHIVRSARYAAEDYFKRCEADNPEPDDQEDSDESGE